MKYFFPLLLLISIGCDKASTKYEVNQCVTLVASLDNCSNVWKIASISTLFPLQYATYPSVRDQDLGCEPVVRVSEAEIKSVVNCPEDFYERY